MAAQRWLKMTEADLAAREEKSLDPLVGKFLEMGLPVLKRFKSGFLAEMGDIQMCLLVHVEDTGEVKVQLCRLDDEGQLTEYLTLTGAPAQRTIQFFVQDFPAAVLTTSTRKPLCLFAKPQAATAEGPTPDTQSLGLFQGYMDFVTFQRIVNDHSQKVSVAVPK